MEMFDASGAVDSTKLLDYIAKQLPGDLKALVEANRATFSIKSARNAGTLVEITFPPTRVLTS